MPDSTFDPQRFATDLGLDADGQAAMLGLFDKYPTAKEKFTSLITAQVESAMAPLRADLQKRATDVENEMAMLESVRSADSATLDTAHKRVETAMTAVTTAQERIRRLATQAGVDPEEWLKDLSTTPSPPPESKKPVVDSPMLDSTKLLQQSGLQAWNAFRSSVEMQDIINEHATLFGKPLNNALALVDKLQDRVKRTGNGNLTLRDIWHDEYKVPEKRQELQEAQVKKREDDAYERGKREAADSAALGSTTVQQPVFAQSPVLAQLTKDAPTRVMGLPEGVVAAIADYRQRRMNQKTA
jgi:hypothetical protein